MWDRVRDSSLVVDRSNHIHPRAKLIDAELAGQDRASNLLLLQIVPLVQWEPICERLVAEGFRQFTVRMVRTCRVAGRHYVGYFDD